MKTNDVIKRQLIAVTTDNLARQYEFDDITVDMICNQAQVSRSSFYRLFQDKYDILKWCELLTFSRGISQLGRSLNCLKGITVTLECFGLFRTLFVSTRNSTERQSREDAGKAAATQLLCDTITECHGLEIDKELDFQISWFISGLLEQCVILSKDPNQRTIEEVAKHINSCCPARLYAILNNPPDSENPEISSLNNIVIKGPLL